MTTRYFLLLLLFHFFWPLISFSHFISSFVIKKVSKCIPVTASNAPKHLTNDKTNAIPRYPIMENNTDKPYTWNGFWNIKITHHVILIQYVWWGEKTWEKKANVNHFTINRIALQYKWKTYLCRKFKWFFQPPRHSQTTIKYKKIQFHMNKESKTKNIYLTPTFM